MTPLRDFIAARLDEDEAAARAAADDAGGVAPGELGPWVVGADTGDHLNPATVFRPSSWSGHIVHACNTEYAGREALPVARHIARHDPARVLREVAAKRAILAAHADNARTDPHDCIRQSWYERETLCWVIRQMAAAHSNHEDYRPEWGPEAWPEWVPIGRDTEKDEEGE